MLEAAIKILEHILTIFPGMDGNRDRAYVAAILVFLPEDSLARPILWHYWTEEHMLMLDNDPSHVLRWPPRGPMFSRAQQATIEKALETLQAEVKARDWEEPNG